MYVITLKEHPSGVYSIIDDDQDKIIPIFENQSDAERYIELLKVESTSDQELQVSDVDEELMIDACWRSGQRYSIITEDDFIVPPNFYDLFSKNSMEEFS